MELGPCASSSFEPCQARKGAALRGNATSAAGCLGSMAGSFAPCRYPLPSPYPTITSIEMRLESLQNRIHRSHRTVGIFWHPTRFLQQPLCCSQPRTIPQLVLCNFRCNHASVDPARENG